MGNFFKENWIWILAPALLLGALVLLRKIFSGEALAPFEYALF